MFILGNGVFVTRDVIKGSFLLEYKGTLLSAQEGDEKEIEYGEDVGSYLYFFKDQW